MNKMRRKTVEPAAGMLMAALLCSLAMPAPAAEDALASCAAIEDLSARLACYDGVARRGAAPRPEETPVVAPPAAEPVAPVAPVVAEPAASPAAPAAAAEAKPAAVVSEKEQRFGAESLPRKPGEPAVFPDDRFSVITSRIVGDFTSSRRGTEFVLENGQVWKSVEILGSSDYAVTAPSVTIERAALATYQMQVEGVKKRVTVRRVK